MIHRNNAGKYLPLTEATYYIMLTLIEPLHGYAVMQKVEKMLSRMSSTVVAPVIASIGLSAA